jgi:hypothetical protein
VTPIYKSELNTVPIPGSKTVLARDSRQRQALMMLLDVLGLTTDEVPIAVGAHFSVFRASALKTGDAGDREDRRGARMYQDRCHAFLMHFNFFLSSPCRRTSSATRRRVVQPISEVRCPDFCTVTCRFNYAL